MIREILKVVLVTGIYKCTVRQIEVRYVRSDNDYRHVLAGKQLTDHFPELLIHEGLGNDYQSVKLVGKCEFIYPVLAEELLLLDIRIIVIGEDDRVYADALIKSGYSLYDLALLDAVCLSSHNAEDHSLFFDQVSHPCFVADSALGVLSEPCRYMLQ